MTENTTEPGAATEEAIADEKPKNGFSQLLANRGTRNVLLVTAGAGVLAVGLAFMIMSPRQAPVPQEISGSQAPMPQAGRGEQQELTPRMAAIIESANAERANQAESTGQGSVMPTPLTGKMDNVPVSEAASPQEKQAIAEREAGERERAVATAMAPQRQVSKEEVQATALAINALSQKWTSRAHNEQFAPVITTASMNGQPAGQAPGAAPAAAVPKEKLLFRAGDMVSGAIVSAVSSDMQGPVLATILTGDYRGARLVGGFTKNEDTVSITFRTMSLPNGSVNVTAQALDAETLKSGIATSVDRKYFERFILKPAAALIKGYAEASSRANTTTTTTLVGSTSTTGPLSSSEKKAVALGEAAKEFDKDISKRNTDPVAHIDPADTGALVGILFTADVRAKEDLLVAEKK